MYECMSVYINLYNCVCVCIIYMCIYIHTRVSTFVRCEPVAGSSSRKRHTHHNTHPHTTCIHPPTLEGGHEAIDNPGDGHAHDVGKRLGGLLRGEARRLARRHQGGVLGCVLGGGLLGCLCIYICELGLWVWGIFFWGGGGERACVYICELGLCVCVYM